MEELVIPKHNYYYLETLDYHDFAIAIKEYAQSDNQDGFIELCKYSMINKPNYIPIILTDEDIAPYLSLKYINILTMYPSKKLTLRILFEYFNLPCDKINFLLNDKFDINNFIIKYMGNPNSIVYPIGWDENNIYESNEKKKQDAENKRKLFMVNSNILDIELDIESFSSCIYTSDSVLYFDLDSELDVKIKDWIRSNIIKEKEYYLYPSKQIAYYLYDLIIQQNIDMNIYTESTNNIEHPNNIEIIDSIDENKSTKSDNKSIKSDIKSDKLNIINLNKIKQSELVDYTDLFDPVDSVGPMDQSRPILIMIDEPDSNTKFDKIFEINNSKLQIIYNYKKENYKSISDALVNCSKLFLDMYNQIK